MGSTGAGSSGGGHECSFKILLIGDSGVGKSSLLVSFVAASHLDGDIAPTIGTHGIRRHATPLLRCAALHLHSLACCPSAVPPRRARVDRNRFRSHH